MKYDVTLTGTLNASEEQGTENTITIKQELKVSEEVKALVDGLQEQIDEVKLSIQSMTGTVQNLNTSLEALKTTVNNLKTSLEALEDKVDELVDDPGGNSGGNSGGNPGGNPGGDTFNLADYGAVANDGKSDSDAFTRCFNAAGNKTIVIPSGTFQLPWSTSSTFQFNRLMSCTGTGRIQIDDFPQPGSRKTGFNPQLINPLYEDGFGRFNIADVKDDVFMSMNMVHEHRSVMNMYHQNYAGVKTRYNQNEEHPKWVPWGQCALRLDKSTGPLPSGNVTFNIGKFGVMIYRKSTKKWEFEPNPFASGGGFFLKTYDQTTSAVTRTINKAGGYVSFTVPINKTVDYIVHYWTAGWDLKNVTDIQYAIVFSDVWLDSSTPNLEEYFVCNLGLDMKTPNFANINEFLTGRFIDVTYKKRRNFMHNIMESYYKDVTGGGETINKLIDAKTYSVDY